MPARNSGGRTDSGEDAGGFSNALSGAGGKSQKTSSADEKSANARVNAGDDQHEDEDGKFNRASDGEDAGDNATTSTRGKSTKPIIDIRGHASFNNTSSRSAADADVEKLAGDSAEVQENTRTEGKKRATGQATKDAYQQMPSKDAYQQMASKDGSAAAAEGVQQSGGRDKQATASDDEQANSLEDVLTLLAGGADAASTAGAHAAKHSMRGGEQSDEKVEAVTARSGEGRKATVEGSEAAATDEGSTDATDNGGRKFRFARADGKGQPLILSIGAGANGNARAEAAKTASEATQNVTVVDARRYIAPASTSNLANVTGALSGNPEWLSAMQPGSELANAASQSSSGNVVNTLKIQLHPIDLGQVTATLRLSGEALTIHLTVENSAALKSLNDDHGEIMKALRSQGFAVDSVQITMAATPDRSSADAGQNSSQQQSGQQASAQGGNNQSGFTGGGQSGGQGTSSDVDANNRSGMTSDDSNAATNASGNAGGARPDHVYI